MLVKAEQYLQLERKAEHAGEAELYLLQQQDTKSRHYVLQSMQMNTFESHIGLFKLLRHTVDLRIVRLNKITPFWSSKTFLSPVEGGLSENQ